MEKQGTAHVDLQNKKAQSTGGSASIFGEYEYVMFQTGLFKVRHYW